MKIVLQKGAHRTLEQGGSAMEFAAWAAGEPHSDHPQCVSPVIAEFARSWNDAMSDADRQQLVPVLLDCIGTNTGPADEEARAWMCLDWLARVQAPAWLRLAGLTEHAQGLEGSARIVDARTAGLAQPSLAAAGAAAAGAAAAGAAALAAARAAAAGAAAWAAERAAARAAAAGAAARWAAAVAAAGAAARAAAAGAALRPTVVQLQASALNLLRAMCAVGRVEVETVEERVAELRLAGATEQGEGT